MKGYGSKLRLAATALKVIQRMTMTDWMARKRAVPKNRASVSENRPNASGS